MLNVTSYPCLQKRLWGCKALVAVSENAKMQVIIKVWTHLLQSGHSPHYTACRGISVHLVMALSCSYISLIPFHP